MLFFWLLIFLLGLSFGSFVNVLIYRLPRSLSLLGRSHCPACRRQIRWFDNIPLLSFFYLGGRCRDCHSPISLQYPIVELVTGVLFVVAIINNPFQNYQLLDSQFQQLVLLDIFYLLLVTGVFVAIFFIDLKYQIIPDSLVYPLLIISLMITLLNNRPPEIINYLLSAVGAFAFFFFLFLVTKSRGMGFGDVKFAVLIGLVLGFPKTVLTFYGAFLTGALAGVILILIGRKKFGQPLAFGPFLAGWTLISLYFGEEILKWMVARFF